MERTHCVLLVDDDEVTNFINCSIIEEAGISKEVHVANDGEEALTFVTEYCSKHSQNKDFSLLIFLDINMPGLNGFETLDTLKEEPAIPEQDLKVVFLSSSGNQKDMQKAREYNTLGYLSKPLTIEKLNQLFS